MSDSPRNYTYDYSQELVDEATDAVIERWVREHGMDPVGPDAACRYGHFDDSYTADGPCLNEAIGVEITRLRTAQLDREIDARLARRALKD